MSRRNNLVALVLLWLFLVSPAVADAPATKGAYLTESQAVRMASDFCQSVGLIVTVPGTAKYPVPEGMHVASPFWQSCWLVVFPGQAEIEVADEAGRITYFSNEAFAHEAFVKRQTQAGKLLPQSEAIRLAGAALQAAGPMEELSFSQASLDQLNSSGKFGSSTWFVLWKRAVAGVAYHNQHASVSVDAATGEITGLAVVFPSPPAAVSSSTQMSRSGLVTTGQAAAAERLKQFGVTGTTLKSVRTEIVQPNEFWQGQIAATALPSAPRPALVCQFVKDGATYSVWMDADTGAVIGGEVIGRKGMRRNAAGIVPIQEAVKMAQRVSIVHRDFTRSERGKVVAVLSAQSYPDMFSLFKRAEHLHAQHSRARVSDALILICPGSPPVRLSYDINSGELGLDGPTVTVPLRLKNWILKLQPAPGMAGR